MLVRAGRRRRRRSSCRGSRRRGSSSGRTLFEVLPWDETDDPIEIVAGLVQGIGPDVTSAAIGDHTWARFLVDLQAALPDAAFRRGGDVTGPLRAVKDAAEIDALRAAAARRRPTSPPAAGGRRSRSSAAPRPRCRPSSATGSSPRATNASTSPSSPPARTRPARTTTPATASSRRARSCCATSAARCRTGLLLRHHPLRRASASRRPRSPTLYAVLLEAQAAGVAARPTVGTPLRGRRRRRPPRHHRRRLRRVLHPSHRPRHRHRGARGPVHRRGQHHAAGAGPRLLVEPGIYLPGRLGLRLEDIVVATAAGPERLNHAARRSGPRGLAVQLDLATLLAAVGDRRAALPAGSPPVGVRSASATAGCSAARTGSWPCCRWCRVQATRAPARWSGTSPAG